jgi:hypothetical protein
MSACLAANVRDRLAGCPVDHQRVRGPRNVDLMCLRVDGDVVPGAFTAELQRFYNGPIRLSQTDEAAREQHRSQGCGN